jgi:hypothetical protein
MGYPHELSGRQQQHGARRCRGEEHRTLENISPIRTHPRLSSTACAVVELANLDQDVDGGCSRPLSHCGQMSNSFPDPRRPTKRYSPDFWLLTRILAFDANVVVDRLWGLLGQLERTSRPVFGSRLAFADRSCEAPSSRARSYHFRASLRSATTPTTLRR